MDNETYIEKMEFTAFIVNDDGTIRKEKRVEELVMRARGRHFWFCNMCGRPDYPDCRSWCKNGKIEEK